MPPESTSSDLSISLLYGILRELGHVRELPPIQVTHRLFEKLVEQTELKNDPNRRSRYICRHLDYLEEAGYIRIGQKPLIIHYAVITLSLQGQHFVQPELAEFGREPLLPQVVKSIEDRIEILTYPQEEKDSMRYRLRDALTKQAPDFFAKVLAEIAYKAFKGE